jgi:hypothetical protein
MNHLKDMDVEVKNWNSAVGNVDNKAKESISNRSNLSVETPCDSQALSICPETLH